VLLLLGRRHPPDPAAIPPGVEVEFINNRGHYDLPAAWRARRLLRAFAPDAAFAHCSRSVALLRRALGGVPLLAVSHSSKVRRLTPADACIALNTSIRERFEHASGGKPCFVVPNSIKIRSSEEPPVRAHRHPPCLAALGRLDPVKGFDVFVDALGLLIDEGRQFRAVLAGAGGEQQALQRRAAALGLSARLTFPGWVDDVDRFLASTDVVCVPARSDAFGLTPLQAARAGVPMVLSTAEGHRDMFVPDEQALYADIGDSRQTAQQLARLLDHPQLARRLSLAAFRKAADCYSEQAVAERVFHALEMTINKVNR
jgi:glycosyltransferase involved in cell wall biosynthesis